MSFVRPEARAALWRWREMLAGGGVLLIGLWWVLAAGPLLQMIGGLVCIAGAALLYVGVQRGRFRGNSGGPGILRIDEGQIAYFGPLTGGAVALSEITSLSLDATGRPGHWVITQPGQPDLAIPVNAEGADDLFDVFASLPGLRTEKLLSEMRKQEARRVTLWQRPHAAPRETKRLH